MRNGLIVAGLAATLGMAPAAAQDRPAVDAAVHAAMTRTHAQGLAIALIERGKPVLVRAYGVRNAKGDPLTTKTIMYGASLTKAVFAYAVMQLVDARRIDLDKPVASLLAKPLPDYGNLDAYGNWGDLKDDPRWAKITPRMVLTHSTGFANFAYLEPDHRLRIHFDPGSRYAYSGEGIELLQFGVEQGLGLSLGAQLQSHVFDPLGMADTSLEWRPAFAANLADGWTLEGKVEPHDARSRVRAAGSMDTTVADMARFAAALVSGRGLGKAARAEMVRPQLAITTRSQFPTLLPELPPAERYKDLSAGLGVVTFTGPQGPGFYKTGHNDSTGNMIVCLEKGRRCVVILSNDVRAEAGFGEIVHAWLGETGLPWKWEYGPPAY